MNFDGWKGIKKLIHYSKEKRTVIHKPEMEEKSTEEKYEELESSSPSANSNTEQISEDPLYWKIGRITMAIQTMAGLVGFVLGFLTGMLFVSVQHLQQYDYVSTVIMDT